MANDEPPPVDESWGTLVSRLTEEAPRGDLPLRDAGVVPTRASTRRWIPIALVVSALTAVVLLWRWPPDRVQPAVTTADDPKPPAAAVAPAKAARPAEAPPVQPPLEQLLVEAEAALTAGDPDRAMALLQSHAERAPIHAQATQRMALRVLVLCAQGKHEQARDEGKAFLAAHRQSQWSDAVRRSCAASRRP